MFTFLRHQYPAVAHILTHSVNLAFGPKSGFKNKCRARAGFGLVISGLGRVRASKCGTFTTLVETVYTTQSFWTLWPNWLNLFGHFKTNSVDDWKNPGQN